MLEAWYVIIDPDTEQLAVYHHSSFSTLSFLIFSREKQQLEKPFRQKIHETT